MSLAIQVGVAVLGSTVVAGLTLAVRWWIPFVVHQRVRSFWKPLAQPGLTVVVGRHAMNRYEPSGLMGVADAKAIDELRDDFRKRRLGSFDLKFVDEIEKGTVPKGPLLCIGSPDTGAITAEDRFSLIPDIWASTPTTFRWWPYPQDHDIALYDMRSPDPYDTALIPHPLPDVRRDYALIVRTHNPYHKSSWALLVAGCTGYGTWGAIELAMTDKFTTDGKVKDAESIECLVSVEVSNSAPTDTELKEVRRLAQGSNAQQLLDEARMVFERLAAQAAPRRGRRGAANDVDHHDSKSG